MIDDGMVRVQKILKQHKSIENYQVENLTFNLRLALSSVG